MYKRNIVRNVSTFLCIILLHSAGIFYFMSASNNNKNVFEERLLVMLLPENHPQKDIRISIQDPITIATFQPAIIAVPMPDFAISNVNVPDERTPSPDSTKVDSQAVGPPSESRNATIFDPRLRKRLGESVNSASADAGEIGGSWVRPSGTQVVAVGDGKCIKSMPKLGDERGTRWSLRFACGKSDSEIMADEISRNLQIRK